jgi:hypothetical protein
MNRRDVAVATITWARDEAEARVLERALAELQEHDLRIAVTDGGSSETFLCRVSPTSRLSFGTSAYGPGIVGQVKSSVATALNTGAEAILYTEPDKAWFFKHVLTDLLDCAPQPAPPTVLLAARSARTFETFPPFQRCTEAIINELAGRTIGRQGDYSYGPFLMDRRLARHVLTLPNELGWGWRHCAFGLAARLGYQVSHYVDDLPCPEDQRRETQADLFHRLKQLDENSNGLRLSYALPLSA